MFQFWYEMARITLMTLFLHYYRCAVLYRYASITSRFRRYLVPPVFRYKCHLYISLFTFWSGPSVWRATFAWNVDQQNITWTMFPGSPPIKFQHVYLRCEITYKCTLFGYHFHSFGLIWGKMFINLVSFQVLFLALWFNFMSSYWHFSNFCILSII